MKKYLSIFLILFAVMATETGCETNNPEEGTRGEVELNQPLDPATWSPEGKMYVCDRSGNNPYGLDVFFEVIEFKNKENAIRYGTTNPNLTPSEDYYNEQADYICEYPNVKLFIGLDERPLIFKDTLTLYSDWWKLTYNYQR